MRLRYLAAIYAGGTAEAARERTRLKASLPESFKLVFDNNGVLIFANCSEACLASASAMVIGSLFARGKRAPSESLTLAEWTAIEHSRGTVLTDAYWGSYIAFLVAPDGAALLRAPFGDLGCYHCRRGNTVWAASDLTLLLATAKMERRVAIDALVGHIAFPEWRSRETCLEGVFELRGGDNLSIASHGIEQVPVWSPWRFVSDNMQISDPDDAVGRVGDAVRLAVAARTSGKRCLLLLSGGLDSAVVAAVMRGAGTDFAALNLVANDMASDETRYARLVAEKFVLDCDVRHLELDRVDVRHSAAADMPYPAHRCFTQALDAVAAEAAEQQSAEIVVDGGGGDNVFFASRTVSIVADCLLTSGFDARFWRAARILGDLAQTGMATVLRKTVARAFRSRPPPLQMSAAFLSSAAKADAAARQRHPWFTPPDDVLPGRASHVALLAPAQNLVEALNAQACYPSLSPLVSQPVVEACLRVPSWLWIAPGMNRAAVRRAFEAVLPAEIVHRRSKGAPTAFVAAIFERNLGPVREMLLGGILADAGILDRDAVATALAQSGPTRDLRFVRIMELVDTEAWARAQSQ